MATKQILLGVADSLSSGVGNLSSLPVQFLLNGENQAFRRSIEIPIGYTTISSITLRYVKRTSGNLYLRFVAGHTPQATDSTLTEDSTAATTYTVAGTNGKVENITVPSTTYNALTSMVKGDMFSIAVQRDATSASDTYEDDLEIVGFLIEFTVANVSGGAVSAATNAIVLLDWVKDYCSISLTDATYDDFLQLWINQRSQWIEDYIQNKVVVQTLTNELYDGDGTAKLYPDYFPIVALGAVGADAAAVLASLQVRDDVDDTWADVETNINHIILDVKKPYIRLYDEIFPWGRQTVKITYRAGWSTIPQDIIDACMVGVFGDLLAFKKGSRFGLDSSSLAEGGGNVSTQYKDLPKQAKELLSSYRKFC